MWFLLLLQEGQSSLTFKLPYHYLRPSGGPPPQSSFSYQPEVLGTSSTTEEEVRN